MVASAENAQQAIYLVSALRGLSRARVGALGYHLARIGHIVPTLPGFCLTTTAYTRHLRRAGLPALLARARLDRPADADRLAAFAATAIQDLALEPSLRRAVERGARPGETWLVRTSSSDLDPFVQEAPSDELPQLVRVAWANAWTPRRVRARARSGGSVAAAPVALLLQRLPPVIEGRGLIHRLSGGAWDLGEISSLVGRRLTRLARRVPPPYDEVHWLLAGRRLFAIEVRGDSTSELTGVAASPGSIRGRARLVRTARDIRQVSPDEIVVCTTLLPGLTAWLRSVGGVVAESGGSTSHLAVVARQFGVPAVMAVRGATHRIEDGQLIFVDGTRGRVRRG